MTSFGNRLGRICRSSVAVVIISLAVPSCEKVETKEERLVQAARGGDVAAVERLLTEGADPNWKDANGVTPLLVAAERGDVASVEALIKRGAAVNSADVHGQTPLMLSAWSFRYAAVAALLRHRADPCLKSRDGRTALVGSLLRSDQLDPSAAQQLQVIDALRVGDCDYKGPAPQASSPPATPAIVAAQAANSRAPQRLAFIVGYLDLFGKAMTDRGGKEVGGRYATRADMMRDVARRHITSQEEFVRNVDDGIRRAMNDYNSLDNRAMALTVINYEQEGLLLMIRLVDASNVAGAAGAAAVTGGDGSNPGIVDRWEAFVQQLPQDSNAAAEAINGTYAIDGIPFPYWVARGVDPSTTAGLHIQPHPCGRVTVLQAPTIPPEDARIDSDRVYEMDKTGRTIHSWSIPVDQTPDGVDGDELFIPSHAGGRKDLLIAIRPDGRYRVVPALGNRPAPTRVMCPPHTLFKGSAYVQCMLVRGGDPRQTERYLAYEAPCS